MKDFNIFDKIDVEERRNFFRFNEVGDKVQGTFINRSESIDNYNNEQTLVDLKQSNGEVITVSIRNNKTGLLNELNKVSLGQIIGFAFTGTKDNPGKHATKFIRLVHDPKYVDEAWLKEEKEKEDVTTGKDVDDLFDDPAKAEDSKETAEDKDATKVEDKDIKKEEGAASSEESSVDNILNEEVEKSDSPSSATDSDKLKEIAAIAKEKFIAETVDQIKEVVFKETGLELVSPNLDKILEKLKG